MATSRRRRVSTATPPPREAGPVHPTYALFYAVVAEIPRGRVATYGQVARIAGLPGRARQVGYALHALPAGSPIPWQRVVNTRGELSLPDRGGARTRQRTLLEQEGVEFSARGRISLREFRWQR